jgi:mannose-6-phosphate isomerase-like protein (cupin superfamily)
VRIEMIKKINKLDIKPEKDPCGLLRELYKSKNLSIAYVVVLGEAEKHMHRRMEEVYYVEKGEGKLVIGDKILDIKAGDVIPIPKNTWHHLKKLEGKPLEVLVITCPKFDPDDLIRG